MSTKKFVTIITVALLVFIAIVSSVAFATAEESTYQLHAVVVSYETTQWEDIKVDVIDSEGTLWEYYVDPEENVAIGDVILLTFFDFEDEEEDEIIDAIRIDHLDTLEMIQWIRH